MIRVSNIVFLVFCAWCVIVPLCANQHASSSTPSEDVSQLFDGDDDALDHVTVGNCGRGSLNDSLGKKPSIVQAYCQSALLYLLSHYFAVKKLVISAWQWTSIGASASCKPN